MNARLQVLTLSGEQTLVLDAEIPDDAPDIVREGMARRALVNRGQACPCGARSVLPNRAERRRNRGRVIPVVVMHDTDCPAGDTVLLPALWRGGAR